MWPPEDYAQAAAYLKSAAVSSDLVLFSPGYADSDFVANPDTAAKMRGSYLSWPLTAHLPRSQMGDFWLVPLRRNGQTAAYLDGLARKAGGYSRVWCVGSGYALRLLVKDLSGQAGFISWSVRSFGIVKVNLLEFNRPPASVRLEEQNS